MGNQIPRADFATERSIKHDRFGTLKFRQREQSALYFRIFLAPDFIRHVIETAEDAAPGF
jgi:hypothetical protein